MTVAPDLYTTLMAGADADRNPFDVHVIACIVTIASTETALPLTDAVGLDPDELSALFAYYFPDIRLAVPATAITRPQDEECLVTLLTEAAATRLAGRWLAAMVARRAQRPDHLWQDLGLRARTELSQLMLRHFQSLAVRNTRDMKWKKFLYRSICADAGFSLCTAPSCNECTDFDECFGDESGESFLARTRRESESAAIQASRQNLS